MIVKGRFAQLPKDQLLCIFVIWMLKMSITLFLNVRCTMNTENCTSKKKYDWYKLSMYELLQLLSTDITELSNLGKNLLKEKKTLVFIGNR